MPGREQRRGDHRAAADARNATSRDGGIAAPPGEIVPFWAMASIGLGLVVLTAPALVVALSFIVAFFLWFDTRDNEE
jgi:hypothetical protein